MDGVLAVHEFHVWQLAGERIIASAHIRWVAEEGVFSVQPSHLCMLVYFPEVPATAVQAQIILRIKSEPCIAQGSCLL